jgi:IS1 transposase
MRMPTSSNSQSTQEPALCAGGQAAREKPCCRDHLARGLREKKAVAAQIERSPVSKHINTSFDERNNLTMRHQNRRLTRKTIAFSMKRELLEQQLHLAFAYHHFIKPHLGLRVEVKGTDLPIKLVSGYFEKLRD